MKEYKTISGERKNPFSRTSKMPWLSFNLPASKCKTGSTLDNDPESPCYHETCYAKNRRYTMPSVQEACEQNYENLEIKGWKEAFVIALVDAKNKVIKNKKKTNFFRWFDSGDIQNEEHLENMVYVAEEIPNIRFWLSTHEFDIVNKYVKSGKTIPKNLKIRVSDKHLEQERNEYQDEIDVLNKLPNVLCQIGTAGVSKDTSKITCVSSQQDNKCFGDKKECADCWLDSNNNRQVYKEK